MRMIVKDISYKKLQLAVLEGKVDLSHLNVFKSAFNTIPSLSVKIQAGIIGTSHFVQIENAQGEFFTEIFACDVLEKKDLKPLCFLPIDEITSPVKIPSSHSYEFSFQKQNFYRDTHAISKWTDEVQKENPFIFLEYDFNADIEATIYSRTILLVRTLENGSKIEIKTVHEYQEEDVIILSHSQLKLD